ncbi:zinc-binding dehydrogenase [Hornefia butyriciproducens]|uniref:zinc-binding dehydrogenase n=1 Tax=Hornefia butyriciproducens TaxID=2652293 RepID=UPI003F893A4D
MRCIGETGSCDCCLSMLNDIIIGYDFEIDANDNVIVTFAGERCGNVATPFFQYVYTNGSGENEERVKRLGAERFIDYKKENYADVLANVDHVLDTLGDRELPNEFKVLKNGGSLVSLRGFPNGRFAKRSDMSLPKRILCQMAGRKYDKMTAKKDQTYDFLFVYEDGRQLENIGKAFDKDHPLEASVDEIFRLNQINEAMTKVKCGKSKGKTIVIMEKQE